MALELGNHPPMPLDFSSSGTRGSSPVDVEDSGPSSPQGSSAFRVVTPKGRDGECNSVATGGLMENVGLLAVILKGSRIRR